MSFERFGKKSESERGNLNFELYANSFENKQNKRRRKKWIRDFGISLNFFGKGRDTRIKGSIVRTKTVNLTKSRRTRFASSTAKAKEKPAFRSFQLF